MPSILPAGDAVYTYTYLVELNKIFYEYEIKGRKEKSSPKNITKPRTREEVKGLLNKQLTVLDKTIFLLSDVSDYLTISEQELDNSYNEVRELLDIFNKFYSENDESTKKNLAEAFENKKNKINLILKESNYDETPVFKYEKLEDLNKNSSGNKLIIKKREFKKTFKPKLNKFIEEGKKVVFTGLTDEPYFRLPVPAEIPFSEKDITELDLSNTESSREILTNFFQQISEIYSNHKEYVRGYKEKIINLKNNISKTIEDINFTNNELKNIKEAERIEDIKSSITYNSFFPVVEKGMLYNFIA